MTNPPLPTGPLSRLCVCFVAFVWLTACDQTSEVARECADSDLIAQCPAGSSPTVDANAVRQCRFDGSAAYGTVAGDLEGSVAGSCYGNGSCQVACMFALPCPCGIAALTRDRIDCAPCEAGCGDRECEAGETPETCAVDCGTVCGNARCEAGEYAAGCPDCVEDCLEGQSHCKQTDDALIRETCDVHGQFLPRPCGDQQVCRENGQGVAECVDLSCIVGDSRCQADQREVCSNQQKWVSDACGPGLLCRNIGGEPTCVDPCDEPGLTRCGDGGGLETCNDDVWAATPCANGEICRPGRTDSESATCEVAMAKCREGDSRCLDGRKQVCRSGDWDSDDCVAPQQCHALSDTRAECRDCECRPESVCCDGCFVRADTDGLDCDDGDEATGHDVCQSGACAGEVCTCANRDACCDGCVLNPGAEDRQCDDGLFCTSLERCVRSGACVGGPSAPPEVEFPDCSMARCVEANDSWIIDSIQEGVECNDGNARTTLDRCQEGRCEGTRCTCEGVTACCDGCLPRAVGRACDDGRFCTTGETCSAAGICSNGRPTDCDDDTFCTGVESCDEAARACRSPGFPCDRGQSCQEENAACVDSVRVNPIFETFSAEPDIARLPDGFIVVWAADNRDGDRNGVVGQFLNDDGGLVGDSFVINTTTASRQGAPSVSADENGDIMVVWESTEPAEGDSGWSDVFARHYRRATGTWGNEFRVNTHTEGQQAYVDVASANGRSVVVWRSGHVAEAVPQVPAVYARLYDNRGAPTTGELVLDRDATDQQAVPAVAIDADGEFAVMWWRLGVPGDQFAQANYVVRRWDRNGNLVHGDVMTPASGGGEEPSVVIGPDREAVCVFKEFAVQQPGDGGVYALSVSPLGRVLQGGHRMAIAERDGPWGDVAVTSLPGTGLLFAWVSPVPGGAAGVWTRLFGFAGQAIGPAEVRGVAQAAGAEPSMPRVAPAGDRGAFALVWETPVGADKQILFRLFR